MKKMTALLAGAVLMLAASSAMAITFDPALTRPVAIGDAYPGENSLQTELNSVFGNGVVNANTDQVGFGMFQVSTPGSNTITPQLVFEWTANHGTQTVGIFSWNGSSTTESNIFLGGNQPGSTAKLTWNTNNTGKISLFDSEDNFLGQTLFSGINKNSFGFFFKPTTDSPTYYTVDSLNPNGEARVLAYDGSDAGILNSGILFAYEDGDDWDYQDAGFFVESITPVPEPGTMLLLGAGFLGLAIYGKRRQNA